MASSEIKKKYVSNIYQFIYQFIWRWMEIKFGYKRGGQK